MTNKLTELIKEAMQYADNRKDIGELYKPYEEYIAEYLLDNNTIVTPCKVGDVVYVEPKTWRSAYSFINYDHIFANKYYIVADVVSIVKTRKQTLVKLGTYKRATFTREYERYPISAIGKTVFITKEEAEKALKGEGK